MKKYLFLTFTLGFLISSCSTTDNDDLNGSNSTADIQAITNMTTSGSWRISSFVDSGIDETADFDGYTFSFMVGGSLEADNGNNNVAGTWSVTNDSGSGDSGNDDSSEDIDFNIFFENPATFNELSEDWHIVSGSDTKIELIHISGGNGGTDRLIFEKI